MIMKQVLGHLSLAHLYHSKYINVWFILITGSISVFIK